LNRYNKDRTGNKNTEQIKGKNTERGSTEQVKGKMQHTCDSSNGRQNLPILRLPSFPSNKNENLPSFQNFSNKKFPILKTMKRRKISLFLDSN
jgi:hypothetical protein